jgi:tight adherence protein B
VTGFAWAALGAALALLPGPSAALVRADALRGPATPAAAGRASRRMPVDQRSLAVAGCVAVTLGAAVLAGPVLGLAAGVLAMTAASIVVITRDSRAADRREQDLVTALHLLAADLSSGSLPEPALRAAADACPAHRAALHGAADAVARGDPPEFDAPALLPLARAWRVAADTGAPLADVVSRVAGDRAAVITCRRDVVAGVAGARSSAFLLAVLPVLGVLLGAAMQARPLHVLFGSSAGRLLCLVGVTLDACGLAWTHRLTSRAQRA